MSETDRRMTARAAAGDVQAFIGLVERYRAALIGYLYGLTASRADAEELAQEAFCRAWQHLPNIHHGRLASWLYRTAHNLAISWLRRPRPSPLADDPPACAKVRDDPSREVHRAVGELPEDQRVAVALRHFAGLSHDQIAQMLEVPAGTVRSRLSRAYARLRPLLAHLLEDS